MQITEYNFMKDTLIPLVAALIGGLVAGFFSIKATKQAHELELRRQRVEDDRLVRNFLQLIRTEVNILWDRYRENMGAQIAAIPDGGFFTLTYPITHVSYFTAYENNTHLVAKIEDEELRSLIVAVYTQAKAMLDSVVLNNSMLQSLENFTVASNQDNNSFFRQHAGNIQRSLVQYGVGLRQQHEELTETINNLLLRLDRI